MNDVATVERVKAVENPDAESARAIDIDFPCFRTNQVGQGAAIDVVHDDVETPVRFPSKVSEVDGSHEVLVADFTGEHFGTDSVEVGDAASDDFERTVPLEQFALMAVAYAIDLAFAASTEQ